MLKVNTLTGFGGGGGPIDITLTASDENTSDQTVYTFSAKSLGAVDSSRVIFILVSAGAVSTGAGPFDSITVGGNSCTEVIDTRFSNNATGIWELDTDPGGTTADVVVTCPDNANRCGIGIVRVINWTSQAAYDTDNSQSALSLNIPNGGFAIASAYINATSTSVSGLTERYDTTIESSTGHAGAFDSAMAVETGRVIDFTGAFAMVGASFPR